MSNLSLSPHLDARYGNTSNEILFSNLSYGTRILAQDDSWEKLRQAQAGELDGSEDAWIKRAQGANILVSPDSQGYPDFVLRLEVALKDCVEAATGHRPDTALSKEGLLALLDLVEPIYRKHHMPSPYKGPHTLVGTFLKNPHRLVDYIFDHTRAFLTHDLEVRTEPLDFHLIRQFFDRPAMKHRYEQQFCIPLTTQHRARLIIETMKPGSRVLVLGDDDLVSLALVHMTDQLKVDVLELDEDLVAFLHEKGGDRFNVLECNLRYGVPDSMKKVYDCVTTDPPYAKDGMRFFLECARDSLADGPDSRLFLTTYPGLLEDPDQMFADVDDLNLDILVTRKHFSRYIYNNMYRVQQLTALHHLGSPLHPTSELIGFPFLYAHFFECAHQVSSSTGKPKNTKAKAKAKAKTSKAKPPKAKSAKTVKTKAQKA
jgi:hypothetical protein